MSKILGIIAVLCTWAVAANAACTITLPDDIEGFAPVLVTRPTSSAAYVLFKPTGKVTEIAEGSDLLFACTGSKNVITSTNAATLQLQCSGGVFVDANNNVYSLKDLVCKSIPSSTLKLTSNGCSYDRGFIFEAGYTIGTDFFGPEYEICYNNGTETTYYAHNTINGAAIDYSISESTRRSFSAEGMKLTTTKTNNYYTQKNQVTRFESYFGPDQTYITTKDYIARGHLVPDADNIMGYSQLSTYYYANVAPEYQTVNAGNWLRVEELARSIASSYGDDLESYNGYLGILQLPNSNGDLIDIYLDDEGQFPVPKYFFKVLLHKPTDEGIVFLSVNNPFETDGAAMEICENVCRATNWKHINFPDTTKGYTFCCRVEDFLKLYDGLPSDVTASKFMTG